MSVQSAPIGLSSITARQWMILVMVQLTTLLFGMTITSANVVLPQIKGAMSATQDQIAWVVTFNLVATAVATPLVGWLSSRFGWRQMLFTSMCGFTLFSLLCGLAHNLESLVFYRVGQGLFGAPLMPMGQGISAGNLPARAASTGDDDVGRRWRLRSDPRARLRVRHVRSLQLARRLPDGGAAGDCRHRSGLVRAGTVHRKARDEV